MILKNEKGSLLAEVLHVGGTGDGGVWAAGLFPPSGVIRTQPTKRGLELLAVFYVEIAPASPYSYTPPHIWGITYGLSEGNKTWHCVYDMPFNAHGARSTQDVYTIGTRELFSKWYKQTPRCIQVETPSTWPFLADKEANREHVLSLINDFIKPLDRGFHGA